MSSDAEDQLARMTLLVKVLADTKVGPNCLPLQCAKNLRSLPPPSRPSRNPSILKSDCEPVPCTMNGCGVLQGTGW